VELVDAVLESPMIEGKPLFPSECRECALDYFGTIKLNFKITSGTESHIVTKAIRAPIMVMSKACNLYGMSPKQLIQHKEEQQEFGGYFILSGAERIIRMVIANKRNFVR
jgi:DNA-directed RNA polymerase I subunit RPA2